MKNRQPGVDSRIIELRNQKVILDRDVAEIYGVETRAVNRAVKNNADKFPQGYIFELDTTEKQEVVQNLHHLQTLKFPRATVNPMRNAAAR